jgi:hypothetical protein
MTALSATLVEKSNLCQNLGWACYTMQLPTALGSGGTAIDLSADFSTIYGANFDMAITALGLQGAVDLKFVGSADTVNGGILTSATVSLVGYISGSSAAVLTEAVATDLSSVTAAPVIVYGILK